MMCPVFVCLWESLSAAAWSLSPAECLQRSAAEWSEEEELVSCGSFVESVRCVVRAEVWEALAEGLSVSDAWDRVVCAVDDWRAFVRALGWIDGEGVVVDRSVESVVCPVCGGVMRLSTAPLLDSADRWGSCASCGSEALVSWSLGGRVVEVSHDGSGRGLEGVSRMVRDLESEAESSSWVSVSAEEALEEEFVSWPVVASPAGASCVLVGSVYREGGGIVAENVAGDRLGRLILWEDWEDVEEWVSGRCPDFAAGFPVGSWIARRRRS